MEQWRGLVLIRPTQGRSCIFVWGARALVSLFDLAVTSQHRVCRGKRASTIFFYFAGDGNGESTVLRLVKKKQVLGKVVAKEDRPAALAVAASSKPSLRVTRTRRAGARVRCHSCNQMWLAWARPTSEESAIWRRWRKKKCPRFNGCKSGGTPKFRWGPVRAPKNQFSIASLVLRFQKL